MAVLVNLFKKFDKLDDIVYEPIKMVCDLCRQPIKNAEATNERKKMETEARLENEKKILEIELNLKKREHELNIEANNKRISAEINNMIARNELERQSMVVEAIKKYQENLGRVSIELGTSLGTMSTDLKERVYILVHNRIQEYMYIQNEIQDKASDRLKQIEQQFPNGGKGKEILENAVERQLMGLFDMADKFIDTLKNDLEATSKNIDQITAQASANVDKYLSPMTARALNGTMRNTEISYEQKKHLE